MNGGLNGLVGLLAVAAPWGWRRNRPDVASMRVGTAGAPAGAQDGVDPVLLRVLCHELRSPITALMSLTRALAEQPERLGEPDRQAMLLLARDQASHLDGVWRQAARLVQDLTTTPADVRVRLRRILPAVLATAPPERVWVRVSPAAGDRLVAGQRVRQILINLVDNALRHGPPDGRVWISASLRSNDLVLVVADQGRSCTALRAALRRSTAPPGMSGLGLWIVRQFVAVEGGTVVAYRLRSRGVAVEVRLPGRPVVGRRTGVGPGGPRDGTDRPAEWE
ncbi:histidine kinase/DNA gyrase B/HSP90-like ATPase [Micromonospora pisi]|uniref:histidine kinase n=1 Tax=Micromonospora pisi TaxID=589240 RepID=A0A495JMV5_9ACTN|nr:histidine kinase/DNA gyrase B/HSP90-like ATPase [Micromonospora pisi]